MYAIEVTDTRTGITEMSTCRFETIRQAEIYLDKLAFVGGVKRGFVDLLESKEASIVRLEHPLPRVYALTGHGHCFADLPEHNTVEHFLIFQHDQEFFAVDDEIMVGPCSSRDESAHEFGRWKISREINRYNAMKEFLDDARRRD